MSVARFRSIFYTITVIVSLAGLADAIYLAVQALTGETLAAWTRAYSRETATVYGYLQSDRPRRYGRRHGYSRSRILSIGRMAYLAGVG